MAKKKKCEHWLQMCLTCKRGYCVNCQSDEHATHKVEELVPFE